MTRLIVEFFGAARTIAGTAEIALELATGATVRAGIRSLRQTKVKQIVLAVPVAPPETAELLRAEVDELICLATPHAFVAVGAFYQDFSQTTDTAVIAALERSHL